MRFCQTLFYLFAVAFLSPCFLLGQTNQQSGQQYQQPVQRGANIQIPEQDAVRPIQKRPATPEEMRAMQEAISQQQKNRNNPLADGVPNNANYQPQLPEGFPLPADQEQYVSQLLDLWQKSSNQVKRSSCDFIRRSYNPENCNVRDSRNNHLFPFNIALGKLHFAAPDKGKFETDESWNFKTPPKQAGEEPEYTQLDIDKHRERWICDGRVIYQYDYANKRLNEARIPLEFQGKGLVNSPLPFFLFGADKQLLMDRYWIRPLRPNGVDNAYWLEAYPKRVEDARIYKKLEIIIAADDLLPSSMVKYGSNYDPVRNPNKETFEFSNRQVNSHLGAITDFISKFHRPPTPIGFKRVDLSTSSLNQQNIPAGGNQLRR